jgi:hypothetical protein
MSRGGGGSSTFCFFLISKQLIQIVN